MHWEAEYNSVAHHPVAAGATVVRRRMSLRGVERVVVVVAAELTAALKRRCHVFRIAAAGCNAVGHTEVVRIVVADGASWAFHVVAVAYGAAVDIPDIAAATVGTAGDDADPAVPDVAH